MLESIGDVIALLVCAVFVILTSYWMFRVTDKHHDRELRKREDRYFRLSEELDDDYGDDRDTFYYE
ncbi:MAG: hypothetical protein IKS37_00800 [Solobacterium sp.]|jgi:hypothetical protein|nr:hypothetical protein [Solobacterium sp.]